MDIAPVVADVFLVLASVFAVRVRVFLVFGNVATVSYPPKVSCYAGMNTRLRVSCVVIF